MSSNTPNFKGLTLTFNTLISSYKKMQQQLVSSVKALASSSDQTNPGQFILLQFQMAQVTQIGQSISNLIGQVNSMINHAVQNQQSR